MEDKVEESIGDVIHLLKQKADSKEDADNVIQLLESLTAISSRSSQECLSDVPVKDCVLPFLEHSSKDVITAAAKTIAELSKLDIVRSQCTGDSFTGALLNLISDEENLDVLAQAARALGNICCQNDKNRDYAESQNGLTIILALLKKSVSLENQVGAPFLRNVSVGLLFNFIIDRQNLIEQAIREEVMETIRKVLELNDDMETTVRCVLILGTIVDSVGIYIPDDFVRHFINVLKTDCSSEFVVECLDLFDQLSENEKTRLYLAQSELCDILVKLVEKHKPLADDEESSSIVKTSCNLIVKILTTEESVTQLYLDGFGPVYKTLLTWLSSENDELRETAAVAIGNIATTDIRCTEMIEEGVHKLFLELLSTEKNSAGTSVQIAALGVLRNLVIPDCNKNIMLKDGLIEALWPMLETPAHPVIFKLLAILRIVINGEDKAARFLGNKQNLLTKVINWCESEQDQRVGAEAHRLLAALIKNSRDKSVAEKMVKQGVVRPLLRMTSMHLNMVHEALVALCIISALCLDDAEEHFLENKVEERLCDLLENADSLAVPILKNCRTFVDSLLKSDRLKPVLTTPKLKKRFDCFQRIVQIEQ